MLLKGSKATLRMFASYPPHKRLTLPSLSPTMEEGILAKWHKQEGDEIQSGEVLLDIETDKASMPFEIEDESYLAKILVESGPDKLQVGTAIAILVEDEEDIEAFKDYKDEAEQPQPQKEKPKEAAPPEPKAVTPPEPTPAPQ